MAKPSDLPEWDTTQVNAIEPTQQRKEQGWLAPGGVPEKPPFQTFNYWQNEVYRWLKSINEQGILNYDNLTDYIANASFVVDDGNIYKCKVNNGPSSTVVSPAGDLTGTWLPEIVGTVSQSAGASTGSAMERGSNANGNYIKFADGTLFCWHSILSSDLSDTTWTYPAAFSTTPIISGCAVFGGPVTFALVTTPGLLTASFNCYNTANVRQATFASILGMGRWY